MRRLKGKDLGPLIGEKGCKRKRKKERRLADNLWRWSRQKKSVWSSTVMLLILCRDTCRYISTPILIFLYNSSSSKFSHLNPLSHLYLDSRMSPFINYYMLIWAINFNQYKGPILFNPKYFLGCEIQELHCMSLKVLEFGIYLFTLCCGYGDVVLGRAWGRHRG